MLNPGHNLRQLYTTANEAVGSRIASYPLQIIPDRFPGFQLSSSRCNVRYLPIHYPLSQRHLSALCYGKDSGTTIWRVSIGPPSVDVRRSPVPFSAFVIMTQHTSSLTVSAATPLDASQFGMVNEILDSSVLVGNRTEMCLPIP